MIRRLSILAACCVPCIALADSERPDLRGTWKLELMGTNEVELPVVGINRVRSHQIMLVQVQGGQSLIQKHDVCSLQVDSDKAVIETIIPEPWIAALPDKEYPIQLEQAADGSWSYTADLLPLRIGFDPAVTDDALPTDIDSPGVVDWDGDGKPAATIYLDLSMFGHVELYLVQAANTLLEGAVVSKDSVQGSLLLPELRQRTIGGSNRLFVTNPRVTPYPPESTFSMVRVAEGSTCADLLAESE